MTAAPSRAQLAPREFEPPPLLRFAFYSFCFFNLAYYSRIFEWKMYYLHAPLVSSVLALLGAGMEGRLLMTFRTKIGACMAALTVLYAINIPFSTWRSDSFQTFTGDWLKSLTAFVIAASVVVTFKQCRTALNSIGWGAGIASVLVNALGHVDVTDRLQLGEGTLGNSNEMAFILLLGLPFMWLMAADKSAPKVKRLLVLALAGSSVIALLRTGSRTGFIGFAILSLLIFFRASIVGKIAMFLCAILLAGAAYTVVPQSLKERYMSIFRGSDVLEEARNAAEFRKLGSAVESSEARRELLIKSIKVSLAHPLLGVGIGQFAPYMAGIDEANGMRSSWQGTHNTYTQISSETGIPALILFVGVIVFSFQSLIRLYRRAARSPTAVARQVANVCFALIASLVAYSVCVFFEYVGYGANLPMLAGLTIALTAAGKNAIDVAEYSGTRPERQLIPPMARRPLRARPLHTAG